MALWLSFVLLVNFPILIKLLGGLVQDKDRKEMSRFFINCIQKLIKQRDELPPSQVMCNLGGKKKASAMHTVEYKYGDMSHYSCVYMENVQFRIRQITFLFDFWAVVGYTTVELQITCLSNLVKGKDNIDINIKENSLLGRSTKYPKCFFKA